MLTVPCTTFGSALVGFEGSAGVDVLCLGNESLLRRHFVQDSRRPDIVRHHALARRARLLFMDVYGASYLNCSVIMRWLAGSEQSKYSSRKRL